MLESNRQGVDLRHTNGHLSGQVGRLLALLGEGSADRGKVAFHLFHHLMHRKVRVGSLRSTQGAPDRVNCRSRWHRR